MFLFREAKLVITSDWQVYLVVWALSQNITIVIKEKPKTQYLVQKSQQHQHEIAPEGILFLFFLLLCLERRCS